MFPDDRDRRFEPMMEKLRQGAATPEEQQQIAAYFLTWYAQMAKIRQILQSLQTLLIEPPRRV